MVPGSPRQAWRWRQQVRTARARVRTGGHVLGLGCVPGPRSPSSRHPRSTLGRGRTDPSQRGAGRACRPVPRGAEASEAPTRASPHRGCQLPSALHGSGKGGPQRTWGWGSGPQATAPLRSGRGRGAHLQPWSGLCGPARGGRALWAVCRCHTVHGHTRVPGRVCLWGGVCAGAHASGQRACVRVCVVERKAWPVAWGPDRSGLGGHRTA